MQLTMYITITAVCCHCHVGLWQYTVEVSRPGQPLDDASDLLVQLQQSAATVFAQTGSADSLLHSHLCRILGYNGNDKVKLFH